jgi:hypothetical protein
MRLCAGGWVCRYTIRILHECFEVLELQKLVHIVVALGLNVSVLDLRGNMVRSSSSLS